jgi:hypothetical protein
MNKFTINQQLVASISTDSEVEFWAGRAKRRTIVLPKPGMRIFLPLSGYAGVTSALIISQNLEATFCEMIRVQGIVCAKKCTTSPVN